MRLSMMTMTIVANLLAFVVMIIYLLSESVEWVRSTPLNLESCCNEGSILKYMISESILKMIMIVNL